MFPLLHLVQKVRAPSSHKVGEKREHHACRDFAVIKSLVLFLLLIGTTMCAFNVAMTYDYLVTNFGAWVLTPGAAVNA